MFFLGKLEKILEDSLDSIQSPSTSLKIQIIGGKVYLRCKGKTLLCIVNRLLKTKQKMLTSPSNNLSLHLKQTFLPIIWIFTDGEGDGIESRLSSLLRSLCWGTEILKLKFKSLTDSNADPLFNEKSNKQAM